MVSGKTMEITNATVVWLLQNAMLILSPPMDRNEEGGYNIVSLRNIERLERISEIK